jgi:hypothetical protein
MSGWVFKNTQKQNFLSMNQIIDQINKENIPLGTSAVF